MNIDAGRHDRLEPGISEVTRSTVSRYFEMLGNGAEPESLASLFSEVVDFYISGDVDLVPWIGRRKGRAGVAKFFQDLRGQTEPVRLEVRSVVVEGEKAVALGELETRVKSTNKTIKSEFAFEFTNQRRADNPLQVIRR